MENRTKYTKEYVEDLVVAILKNSGIEMANGGSQRVARYSIERLWNDGITEAELVNHANSCVSLLKKWTGRIIGKPFVDMNLGGPQDTLIIMFSYDKH